MTAVSYTHLDVYKRQGMGATLLTDWVHEKKLEEKIYERINEKLAALNDEEDEES